MFVSISEKIMATKFIDSLIIGKVKVVKEEFFCTSGPLHPIPHELFWYYLTFKTEELN